MCVFVWETFMCPFNAATGYYCSHTPIKMWFALGIPAINEIKSGVLVVLPGWHWWCSALTSSLLLLYLSSNTAVYLLCSRHLISYITSSIHSTAIMPLTPKGLFHCAACCHVFVFLNGPQYVELHKSFVESPSSLSG